ncbi:hypothetical protein ACFUIW_33495 [Streptomyces sp. NPDC057245]|uniref:hypothetical protein n=1 Tax=Streptomyces sp. NPDC057245 TaxID=3346065 RepID=UPI003627C3DA
MPDVTNDTRADYGWTALEFYSEARTALGHEPDPAEDVELALAACAHGGSLDRLEPVLAEDLRKEDDWATEVCSDLVSHLFHAADGAVVPRLLLDAVTDPETRSEAAIAEAWRVLGERGAEFARFLAAVRRLLVTVHDIDADDLFEDARRVFEDEVEEERYAAAAERRALNGPRAGTVSDASA